MIGQIQSRFFKMVFKHELTIEYMYEEYDCICPKCQAVAQSYGFVRVNRDSPFAQTCDVETSQELCIEK